MQPQQRQQKQQKQRQQKKQRKRLDTSLARECEVVAIDRLCCCALE
jgi:hypothetical protein